MPKYTATSTTNCAWGVLRSGLAAIDGTKLSANAAKSVNRAAQQLARDVAKDILAEAEEVDAAEDRATGMPPVPPSAH